MKNSTEDQVKGKLKELQGTVKEKIGHAINSTKLETEGHDQKLDGKVQKKVGQIEKVFDK